MASPTAKLLSLLEFRESLELEKQLTKNVIEFGLIKDSFEHLLDMTGGFVAGGFTVSTYKSQKIMQDQDMDIWIPSPCIYEKGERKLLTTVEKGAYDYLRKFENLVRSVVLTYMRENGYERIVQKDKKSAADFHGHTKKGDTDYTNSPVVHLIKDIVNFEHSVLKKKIQVIFTFNATMCDVLEHFDLDICKIAYNPYCGFITTLSKEEFMSVHVGKMRVMPPKKNQHQNLLKRVHKYMDRGFILQSLSTKCECCGKGGKYEDVPLDKIDEYIGSLFN